MGIQQFIVTKFWYVVTLHESSEAYGFLCQSIARFWKKNYFLLKKSQILRIVPFRTINLVCINQLLPNFDMLFNYFRLRSLLILVPIYCTVLGKNLIFYSETTDFENCWFPDNNFSLLQPISTKFWCVVELYETKKPIDFGANPLHCFGEKLDFYTQKITDFKNCKYLLFAWADIY